MLCTISVLPSLFHIIVLPIMGRKVVIESFCNISQLRGMFRQIVDRKFQHRHEHEFHGFRNRKFVYLLCFREIATDALYGCNKLIYDFLAKFCSRCARK